MLWFIYRITIVLGYNDIGSSATVTIICFSSTVYQCFFPRSHMTREMASHVITSRPFHFCQPIFKEFGPRCAFSFRRINLHPLLGLRKFYIAIPSGRRQGQVGLRCILRHPFRPAHGRVGLRSSTPPSLLTLLTRPSGSSL